MKENWKSKLGFIMAASGAAVGLGNIQRFPYITAQFGGAAFLMLYLACITLIGLPLVLVELSLGRHAQKNPVAAIASIRPKGPWKFIGFFGIMTAFFILSYYIVAAGWTLGYVIQMFSGNVSTLETFTADPLKVILCTLAMLFATCFIVKDGLQSGVERYNKILMPILIALLLILVLRSLSLPNAWEGIEYYLYPDFSKLNGQALLYALSQAFFSLCIGEAVLLTYGAYANKSDNLISSALYIVFFDTFIAVLAGLILFPAIFALGQSPNQGVGLIYNVMPNIFLQMPFAWLFGGMFFLVLTFAALTTCIALLEIPVSYIIQSYNWSRSKATWVLGAIAFALSIPSALSKGANTFLSQLKLPLLDGTGVYDLMDFAWGNLAMVTGGFFLTIFVAWVWGSNKALKELRIGCPQFSWQGDIWVILIKYLVPPIIFMIMLYSFLEVA